jgi:transketolase
MSDFAIQQRCVNTVRVLSADTVEKAKSGHPGAPMGCAPMAHTLYTEFMNHTPENAKWWNRDRFVLSNGHACALSYCMLHLTGYKVTLDDLKQFRQFGSNTPGHPENFMTEGVEVSTGPLGQGISSAVGLAMASAHLGAVYNKPGFSLFDNFTYVICGDGCMQEGVASEASSLAGHQKLGSLIVLYDDNLITIDGSTDLSFSEDVAKRYEAYGWHVQTVVDGHDAEAIAKAVRVAKTVTDKPSLVKIRTVIGAGSSKEGTAKCHGAPLGTDDLRNVKTLYGFNPDESFAVPEEVQAFYRENGARGAATYKAWNEMFAR